jgi:hypothetical protein
MASTFNFADPTTAATCHHECGHAAAAWLLDLPVESIVLYDEHAGCMSHPGSLHSEFEQDHWETIMAPVALAGPISECFYRRQQQHNLAMARLKAQPEFWSFALSVPALNVDLQKTARYCAQGGRPAKYQRQRARKLFSQVHQAIVCPDIWRIIRAAAEELAFRGCLVDSELQPYCNAARAAGRRWGLLRNL